MINRYFFNSLLIKHATSLCPLFYLSFFTYIEECTLHLPNPWIYIMLLSFNEKYDIRFIDRLLYSKSYIQCVSITIPEIGFIEIDNFFILLSSEIKYDLWDQKYNFFT